MEKEIRRKCIEHYGEVFNIDQTKEECAELIVSLSHYERGKASIEEVIGEVVDVHLMLTIILDMLDPELTVFHEIKGEKVQRVLDRLEEKENE